MENISTLDPNWNPIRPGGLSPHDVAHLKKRGWKEAKTKKLIKEVPVGFSAPDIPGGFQVQIVSIPKGTRFLYHPQSATVVIFECNNPAPKRYLV